MSDEIIEFGKWVVNATNESFFNAKSKEKIQCVCECGTVRGVLKASLTGGKSLNCGCIRNKIISDRNTVHGKGRHELYRVWKNLKSRCFNKGASFFYRYGGRGITVCDEWKSNFIIFYDWAISNGFKHGLQIDRKDNNGNYCPENCSFVTSMENTQNRSTSKITAKEAKEIKQCVSKPASKIASEFGISVSMVGQIKRGESWKNA